jgi:HAD superfamily hydrolase (TIGR01549 family)
VLKIKEEISSSRISLSTHKHIQKLPLLSYAQNRSDRMDKQTVIFDIDGTLIDTEQAVLRGLKSMLKTDYGKELSLKELEFAFGLPGSDSLPQFGIQDVPKANLRWNFFFQQYFHTASVFAGIRELLIALKENRMTTGIVTSKTQNEFKNEFAPFGLSGFFDFVVCSDQTTKHKPDPEPMLKFLEISGARPEDSIYIGDTIYDCRCAQGAGVSFGLAGWGCKHPETIPADYIFHSPTDILSLCQ